MKYKNLGNTGLKVSELCLGCMSFGVPERGDHPWTLPEEPVRPLIRQAVDAGINYFDTANSYSDGTSEEIVGRALKDFTRRDEVVIATKVFFPMSAGPERRRTVPQGHIHGDRRQPAPARNRLRGPLPDPSLGLLDADRRDSRSAARRREERQGALSRRFVDVRLAVQQGPASRPAARLDRVRHHAKPLQPAVPRGRTRNDAAVRGRAHRRTCRGAPSPAGA